MPRIKIENKKEGFGAKLLAFGAIVFLPAVVFAATTGYVPLESSVTGGQNVANFGDYLKRVYEIGITVTIVLAVLYLVIGGFGYITSSASLTKKEDSKTMINNALFGLALALLSYIILSTISPQFTQFSLNISEVGKGFNKIQETKSVSPYLSTPSGEVSQREADMRALFKDAGIGINNGPCVNGQTVGCTNVGGLPTGVIENLKTLGGNCGGCNIIVTGGSEDGHKTHGDGKAVVDLRMNDSLNSYVTTRGKPGVDSKTGWNTYTVGNTVFLQEKDHWHASMKI